MREGNVGDVIITSYVVYICVANRKKIISSDYGIGERFRGKNFDLNH